MQSAPAMLIIRASLLGLAALSLFIIGSRTSADAVRTENTAVHLEAAAAIPGTPAGSADTGTSKTTRFKCPAGVGLLATFMAGDTPSVRIEVGTNVWILRRVPSASGARYSDGTVSFWTKDDNARFESPELSMTCSTAEAVSNGLEELTTSGWKLVSITQDGVTTRVPDGVTVDAVFEDGRVAGKGVCNRYFAAYKAGSDETMSIGDVGATLMMCPEHADFERLYFRMLKASTKFDAHGGTLVLSGPNGSLNFVEDK